LQRTQRLN